jgi:hypothetical protein
MVSMAAQDKKWEREDDARTLARSEEIRSDKARLSNAVKEAKVMAKVKEKEAQAMNKIASRNTAKTPPRNTAKKTAAKGTGATVKSNTNLPFRKSKK